MSRTLLALLLALAPHAVPAAPAARDLLAEDGARAPAHRWPCPGGGAAGNGASSSAPPRGAVEVAWSVELDGRIVGEPLVWDERVLVEVDRGGGERALHTLTLATGARAARPHVARQPQPLSPSLWGNLIAVRRGEDTVELLRWGRRELTRSWTWRAEAPIGPPLLFGPELYVATRAGLARLRVGRRRPVWLVPGDFRGRPALRADGVYALAYDAEGAAALVQAHRARGGVEAQVGIGPHVGGLEAAEEARIAVHARGVFVHSPTPLEMPVVGEVRGLGLPRPLPRGGRFELLPGSPLFACAPAEAGDGWIATLHQREGDPLLAQARDARERELVVLAADQAHPAFVAPGAPWAVADGVAVQGLRAVELESGRVLWRLGAGAGPAVPARETVLAVDGERRLVALRAARAPRAAPIALAGEGVTQDLRAVLRDGEVTTGAFALRDGALVRERGGREERRPLDEVLLLEDPDGHLIWTADVEACARGLELVVEELEREAWTRLADAARGTNDAELMERLAAEAAVRGADDAALARVRQRIEDLEGKQPRVSAARVQRIEAEQAALGGLAAEVFWSRAAALPADAPLRLRTRLLREVLARGPHAGASETVRRMLPDDVAPPAPFDALEWIDFVEAIDSCPLRVVAPPDPGTLELDAAERALARAGASWRRDLVGFQSAHLLIVTPLARPGAIARCLSMGELVCEALEELLAPGAAPRDPERLLVLHLFESRAEYLAQSGGAGAETGVGLEWTSGHYDPGANVSRIYLPAGDAGFEGVMRTYAHELTHHWLRAQCPRFERGGDVDPTRPGFWIVEGFAGMVEDFRFDLAARRWDTRDPRAPRLDDVANLPQAALWPWEELFTVSQRGFLAAPAAGETPIVSTWTLGRRNQVTPRHAFYSQAAAACQALFHADGGARRAALLDYVTAFYTGEDDALDVRAAFGASPATLGAATRAYARQAAERR